MWAHHQPIFLPDLQTGDQTIRVSTWLTALGEEVVAGDPIVELSIKGITFDVAAPASGALRRINFFENADVTTGNILGWIEATTDEPTPRTFDFDETSQEASESQR